MGVAKYLYRKYLGLCARIVREKASPEYIARGWAIGMFFGCASPFGAQLVLSIPLAFVLKGSKIGAALGTLLTNHFTIFIIYPVQCWVGNRLLGGNLSFPEIRSALANVIREQSFEALFKIGGDLVAAFFVGGMLMAAVLTPLTYFGVKKLVIHRRSRKKTRAVRLFMLSKKNSNHE